MQREFTENWNKLCQCVSKPMMDLAQLNINTLNNIVKNTDSLDEFNHSKKPEDFISAQMKLANACALEATKYAQKAMEIGMNAISEANKTWTESCNKATTKAADFVKTSNKGKE